MLGGSHGLAQGHTPPISDSSKAENGYSTLKLNDSEFNFKNIYLFCMCVWCQWVYSVSPCTEASRWLVGIGSLLLLWRSCRTNSGYQPWHHTPWCAEPSLCPLLFFETSFSYVSHEDLKFTMCLSLALNLQLFCLSLLNARIIDFCHLAGFNNDSYWTMKSLDNPYECLLKSPSWLLFAKTAGLDVR